MRHSGTSGFRHLFGIARTAVLLGCLSLLSLQQVGRGAGLLFDAFMQAREPTSGCLALASHPGDDTRPFLSCDRSMATCEAILCDRRPLIPTFRNARPKSQPVVISVFHANARPVLLRTRAVFCDFSLLRCVLHPHFRLLENSTTVLC